MLESEKFSQQGRETKIYELKRYTCIAFSGTELRRRHGQSSIDQCPATSVEWGGVEEQKKMKSNGAAKPELTPADSEVVRAYTDGRISVAGVRKQLGLSDRKARRFLLEQGVQIRTRAQETYARLQRAKQDDEASNAPDQADAERLYEEHEAGKLTQVQAAKQLAISQQNFSVRYLRWRVKKLEAENADLKKQLQKSISAPTEAKRPKEMPKMSLMIM